MKIQTFVNNTLKKINKSIEKDKNLLGRFVIRACTFTVHEEEKTFHYCFEIVDKETNKRHFFLEVVTNVSQPLEKKLNAQLQEFAQKLVKFNGGKDTEPVKDYRKIKLD